MTTYQIKTRDNGRTIAPQRQSKRKSSSRAPRTIALLGGDLRMLSLANMLAGAGHTVRQFAGPEGEDARNTAASLEDAIDGTDAVILPIPASRDGDALNAPYYQGKDPRKISLTEMLLPALVALAPGAEILCGMPSDPLRAAAENAGITLYDYGAEEAFVQENAALTAEGLIPMLEQRLGAPLDDATGIAVVAGYGRVGKAVADRLAFCGVKVTVLCRSAAAMQEVRDKGYAPLSFEELYGKSGPQRLAGPRLLLNTIPAPVFDAASLRCFRGLYVELASVPGGRTDDAAEEMPPASFLPLPGIPGKVLPEKAGFAMGRAVLRRLAHLDFAGKEVSEC